MHVGKPAGAVGQETMANKKAAQVRRLFLPERDLERWLLHTVSFLKGIAAREERFQVDVLFVVGFNCIGSWLSRGRYNAVLRFQARAFAIYRDAVTERVAPLFRIDKFLHCATEWWSG